MRKDKLSIDTKTWRLRIRDAGDMASILDFNNRVIIHNAERYLFFDQMLQDIFEGVEKAEDARDIYDWVMGYKKDYEDKWKEFNKTVDALEKEATEELSDILQGVSIQ